MPSAGGSGAQRMATTAFSDVFTACPSQLHSHLSRRDCAALAASTRMARFPLAPLLIVLLLALELWEVCGLADSFCG